MTFQEAQRKARFGRSTWIGYGPKENRTYERMTGDAIKRAMLAMGTAGKLTVIDANSGVPSLFSWRMACTLRRNARFLMAA
jgi:hypothetical protein